MQSLRGPGEIDLVDHRVVHGGLEFAEATFGLEFAEAKFVTPKVEATIDRLGELAPLQNPINLVGIRACRTILSVDTPQYGFSSNSARGRCNLCRSIRRG